MSKRCFCLFLSQYFFLLYHNLFPSTFQSLDGHTLLLCFFFGLIIKSVFRCKLHDLFPSLKWIHPDRLYNWCIFRCKVYDLFPSLQWIHGCRVLYRDLCPHLKWIHPDSFHPDSVLPLPLTLGSGASGCDGFCGVQSFPMEWNIKLYFILTIALNLEWHPGPSWPCSIYHLKNYLWSEDGSYILRWGI